jgi:pyruvate/2-oxoglutarate dehydrogenase complex dihydrolipoamide dehydrogenase (E3) component
MSLEPEHFDFVVIGGGSAGYAAARTAVAQGLRTAVIDGAETLGGLCILRGCMPSKTLIETANRAITVRRAREFGIEAKSGAVDVAALRQRKRHLIHEFASYRQGQLQSGKFQLLRGRATFLEAKMLEVEMAGAAAKRISFGSACIATGSVVHVPEVAGLVETGFWTSDDILDAETLPDSFVVLGGGAIALEMTHYLEGIGKKVTLVQRGARLLSSMDGECGEAIAKAFQGRGIAVHTGTALRSVERTADGRKKVVFTSQNGEESVDADEILVATGRAPNTSGMGLEALGIKLDGGKILVDPTMQSSIPHIFSAGDVCSPLDVVHLAIQQGEIAARNAAVLLRGAVPQEKMDYRLSLFGVFCGPQAAMVGSSEAELKEVGVPYLTASYPFDDHGKSMVMGELEGFVKIIAHATTGEILGASVVGPEATELIHEIVVAMAFHATVGQLMLIPHYHPTLSEIWTYPAEELAEAVAEGNLPG